MAEFLMHAPGANDNLVAIAVARSGGLRPPFRFAEEKGPHVYLPTRRVLLSDQRRAVEVLRQVAPLGSEKGPHFRLTDFYLIRTTLSVSQDQYSRIEAEFVRIDEQRRNAQ